MNKAEYLAVRGHISFEKPLGITLAIMAADVCLVLLGFWLIGMDSTFSFIAGSLVLTVFYFHNFALLHEAGHNNVHEKRWVNTLIGHYNSIFCFMPYFPWKLMHNEHHTWSGNIDKDPTLKNVKDIRARGKIRWIERFSWQSWIPLAGLMQHIVFWSYPLTLWRSGKMNKKNFTQSLISIGWLVAAYFALFALLPEYVNMGNLWLSFILYLMMTELVNLPHHVNMPTFSTTPERNKLHPWEQHITTRSCYYPKCVSELMVLNFNFHTEHHFFPSLPWYRLRQLRSLIKDNLGQEYTEVVGIGWNLANRAKDPADILLPEPTHPLLQSA